MAQIGLSQISSRTFSGGRPRTARSPESATGRSIRRGCSTIAAISCLRLSDCSARPSSPNSLSLRRMRSLGFIPRALRTRSSSAADGGFFRYWTISGSTPRSRRRLTAFREVLQPGLCQTTMGMMPHLLIDDYASPRSGSSSRRLSSSISSAFKDPPSANSDTTRTCEVSSTWRAKSRTIRARPEARETEAV